MSFISITTLCNTLQDSNQRSIFILLRRPRFYDLHSLPSYLVADLVLKGLLSFFLWAWSHSCVHFLSTALPALYKKTSLPVLLTTLSQCQAKPATLLLPIIPLICGGRFLLDTQAPFPWLMLVFFKPVWFSCLHVQEWFLDSLSQRLWGPFTCTQYRDEMQILCGASWTFYKTDSRLFEEPLLWGY
jgi:hypothetical protein